MRLLVLLLLSACKTGSARLDDDGVDTGDGGEEAAGDSGGDSSGGQDEGGSGEDGSGGEDGGSGESGGEEGESGEDGDPDPGEWDLYGVWLREVRGVGGIFWKITDGGTYYASFTDDPETVMLVGSYWIDGDQISLEDMSGPLACDGEASYWFEVDRDEAIFETIEDPCGERNEVVDGTWERME